MTPEQQAALVVELAQSPTAVDALRLAHRPDSDGRCVGCGRPGYGTPYRHWPCDLYYLASQATDLLAADAAPAAADGAA